MKIRELKQKSETELKKMLDENREKLFKINFNLRQGQVKNTSDFRKIKKSIARILTVAKERE